MKVFKFGGASVRNAEGVRNMASIVKSHPGNMIIVISAMGKMTNALEEVVKYYFERKEKELSLALENIKQYHLSIIKDLFLGDETEPENEIEEFFRSLENRVFNIPPSLDFDFEYDQIVSYGELLSSKITSLYLKKAGISHKWIDIRQSLRTDDTWREGNINWELSRELVPKFFNNSTAQVFLTQGFLGATSFNSTTTLGREGSDYTAAILANIMDAESLTIWKDVPGIMNADPHKFANTQKIDQLSYHEAVEMTYFGAKIIHPNTMKPLVDKNMPLYVRSFYHPAEPGTIIHNFDFSVENIPIFITKEDQVLITLSALDLSFMAEESIGKIYHLFSQYRIKVNIVQQSAMNFSLAIDKPQRNLDALIRELHKEFRVRYNDNLELLTIRNYDQSAVTENVKDRIVFVEQRTRRTARFLLK